MLRLEITESAYMENEDQLLMVVESLHQKGYTMEMDDFGTGYSSLNMLSVIPIDVLKMDRSFIQNLEQDSKAVHLISLILGIAKNLGIPVIAEGVETEGQLLLLKRLGCTLVQGYYFSRPLHPSDFETVILSDSER
jgi:EAL domain-containing protein (putative c-di-GMP-specific phosphodiesterase class I)